MASPVPSEQAVRGAQDPPVATTAPPEKGLRAGTLGYLASVVIAVSSTAPAYSMAATLGLIVAVIGVHTPGMLIAAFLPMLCVAVAFRQLNRVEPDCGTTFAWVARAFGPRAGWLGGWGLIAADVTCGAAGGTCGARGSCRWSAPRRCSARSCSR